MSGRSSCLCPVLANSITSQLVKNGAHKTSDREPTRLVNKQLSDLWKIPTREGHSISEPFRPEEFAAALRRLKPGKSPGLDSIFPKFILTPGRHSNLGSATSSIPICTLLCMDRRIQKKLPYQRIRILRFRHNFLFIHGLRHNSVYMIKLQCNSMYIKLDIWLFIHTTA